MLMDTIRVLVSQTFAPVEAENVAKYAGLKGEPVACAFLLSNVTSYDRNVSLYDNALANCRFRQYIYMRMIKPPSIRVYQHLLACQQPSLSVPFNMIAIRTNCYSRSQVSSHSKMRMGNS